MILKEFKEGYKKGLDGERGRRKLCNYVIISKNKGNFLKNAEMSKMKTFLKMLAEITNTE